MTTRMMLREQPPNTALQRTRLRAPLSFETFGAYPWNHRGLTGVANREARS
jgi:hypothetical protein